MEKQAWATQLFSKGLPFVLKGGARALGAAERGAPSLASRAMPVVSKAWNAVSGAPRALRAAFFRTPMRPPALPATGMRPPPIPSMLEQEARAFRGVPDPSAARHLPTPPPLPTAQAAAVPAAGKWKNWFMGAATPEQLARGNRPMWRPRLLPLARRYANDQSLARMPFSLAKGGLMMMGGNAAIRTPEMIRNEREIGAGQALAALKQGPATEYLPRLAGFALGSDQRIAQGISKFNPNVARNYQAFRGNPQPGLLNEAWHSLSGTPY